MLSGFGRGDIKTLQYFLSEFVSPPRYWKQGGNVHGISFLQDGGWQLKRIIEPVNENTIMKILSNKANQAFWFAREEFETSYSFSRVPCSYLYFIGYAAFLWVAMQGFWSVLKVL